MNSFLPQEKSTQKKAGAILSMVIILLILVISRCDCSGGKGLKGAVKAVEPPPMVLSAETESDFSLSFISEADGLEHSIMVAVPEKKDGSACCDFGVLCYRTSEEAEEVMTCRTAFVSLQEDPSSLPAWHADRLYLKACRMAKDSPELSVKRGWFLMGRGAAGVAFAAHHAAEFQGCLLLLNGDDSLKNVSLLPLANLRNIPVYILSDDKNCLPASAEELTEILRRESVTVALEERFLQASMQESLERGLQWCLAHRTAHERTIWQCDSLENAQAWRGRIEAFENYGKRAEMIVHREADIPGKPIGFEVTPTNVAAFAIDCHDLPDGVPIMVQVTGGNRVMLPNRRNSEDGWEHLYADENGRWRLRRSQPDSPVKSSECPGGLRWFLEHQFTVVVPTGIPEEVEQWITAAERLSDQWQKNHRGPLTILKDCDVKNDGRLLEGNLLLLGRPSDNAVTARLLEKNPSFLRQIFELLPEEQRFSENMGCAVVAPARDVCTAGSALMLFSDNSPKIPGMLSCVLLDSFASGDFCFFDTDSQQGILNGYLDHTWHTKRP